MNCAGLKVGTEVISEDIIILLKILVKEAKSQKVWAALNAVQHNAYVFLKTRS